ncbi:uncharacterized protein G2W53_007987 [Senna tora]|uniref:Uncharacterized protein n=1 Tax=Senna tora TaxID=362788 RepID=A0A835CGF6_9FABA|nr:uncharacterized protein G2W53_007987 [Senna tora]
MAVHSSEWEEWSLATRTPQQWWTRVGPMVRGRICKKMEVYGETGNVMVE